METGICICTKNILWKWSGANTEQMSVERYLFMGIWSSCNESFKVSMAVLDVIFFSIDTVIWQYDKSHYLKD
jgi:hypothetical protein